MLLSAPIHTNIEQMSFTVVGRKEWLKLIERGSTPRTLFAIDPHVGPPMGHGTSWVGPKVSRQLSVGAAGNNDCVDRE